jgi:exportin-7
MTSLHLDAHFVFRYGASKNLRKIEATTFILQNHMSTEIAFCQSEKQHDNRILYFQILCKLLFADDNITERAFYNFMEPFHRRIEALGSLDTVEAFQQESIKVK